MVKYIKGDVLNCKATLVAHQVNAFGVMGGGIAAAIWPLLTPESQSAYVEKCRHNAKLPVTEWMGSIQILDTKREELKICNLFTQFPAPVDGSFDLTAYNYLRQALDLGLRGGESYKTENQAVWHGKRWMMQHGRTGTIAAVPAIAPDPYCITEW